MEREGKNCALTDHENQDNEAHDDREQQQRLNAGHDLTQQTKIEINVSF
jgi:hypothetical protein